MRGNDMKRSSSAQRRSLFVRIAAVVIALCMIAALALPALASETDDTYQYTVRIFAGNKGKFADDKSVVEYKVTPGQMHEIDWEKLVTVTDSRYHATGFRPAGKDNNLVTNKKQENPFKVDSDMDFVVSYALNGSDIKYTIKYLESGTNNKLHDPITYYGNKEEETVPTYIYIDGYVPKDPVTTATKLKDGTTFTCYYTKIASSSTTKTTTKDKTTTTTTKKNSSSTSTTKKSTTTTKRTTTTTTTKRTTTTTRRVGTASSSTSTVRSSGSTSSYTTPSSYTTTTTTTRSYTPNSAGTTASSNPSGTTAGGNTSGSTTTTTRNISGTTASGNTAGTTPSSNTGNRFTANSGNTTNGTNTTGTTPGSTLSGATNGTNNTPGTSGTAPTGAQGNEAAQTNSTPKELANLNDPNTNLKDYSSSGNNTAEVEPTADKSSETTTNSELEGVVRARGMSTPVKVLLGAAIVLLLGGAGWFFFKRFSSEGYTDDDDDTDDQV